MKPLRIRLNWPRLILAIAMVAAGIAGLWLLAAPAHSERVLPDRDALKRCQERALFAGQVLAARDRGLAQAEVRARIERTLREHPELGVPEAELPEILGTVDRVWTWTTAPDDAVGRYFTECASPTGA